MQLNYLPGPDQSTVIAKTSGEIFRSGVMIRMPKVSQWLDYFLVRMSVPLIRLGVPRMLTVLLTIQDQK